MINQVTLVGRLTKDPELRVTTEGTPVTHVTIAVNRHYKNNSGQVEADFVQCTLWRKAAENTVRFCKKGSVVGVTGRIQTRNYDNSEGRKVYVTEVVAEAIQFLGKKTSETEGEPALAKPFIPMGSVAKTAPPLAPSMGSVAQTSGSLAPLTESMTQSAPLLAPSAGSTAPSTGPLAETAASATSPEPSVPLPF